MLSKQPKLSKNDQNKTTKTILGFKSTDFKKQLENSSSKREIVKNNHRREKNLRLLKSIIYKSIIYRYLDFELTYSYFENLQIFIQTINSS